MRKINVFWLEIFFVEYKHIFFPFDKNWSFVYYKILRSWHSCLNDISYSPFYSITNIVHLVQMTKNQCMMRTLIWMVTILNQSWLYNILKILDFSPCLRRFPASFSQRIFWTYRVTGFWVVPTWYIFNWVLLDCSTWKCWKLRNPIYFL